MIDLSVLRPVISLHEGFFGTSKGSPSAVYLWPSVTCFSDFFPFP